MSESINKNTENTKKTGVLYGSVKIELTDAKTGKTETVEKGNMITGALADLFTNFGFFGDDIDKAKFFPVHQKLLGGLALWENVLTEDVNNIHPTAGNKVTGSGVYGLANNGANLVRGSYNLDESSVGSSVIRHVWDFTTNQANGRISSVSLVPYSAGCDGFGTPYEIAANEAVGYATVCSPGWPVGIITMDEKTATAYGLEILSTSQIALVSYDTNLRSVPVVSNSAFELREINRITFDLPSAISSVQRFTGYVASNGHFYAFCPADVTCAANATMYILDIDILGGTCTQHAWKNNTGEVLKVASGPNNTYFTWSSCAAFIHDGYVYIYGNKSRKLYKISLTDPTNVTDTGIVLPAVVYNAYEMGGILYWYSGTTLTMCYDTSTNEIRWCGANLASLSNVLNSPNRYMNVVNRSIVSPLHVICTIDNLETAVTKSESQAMKITYTITQI